MKRQFLLTITFFIFLFGCQSASQKSESNFVKIEGKTMGTTYHITVDSHSPKQLKPQIDQLLTAINADVSTYIPTAVISKFNQSDAGITLPENTAKYFETNFSKAKEIFTLSDGYFDPTVMPLVNYWGFGYTPKKKVAKVDSNRIDSLMTFVGMENVRWTKKDGKRFLSKTKSGVQLDFSALAKGFAVDEIGHLLEKKGIKNYLVEIGGELRAKGKNAKGKWWSIGINVPEETAELSDIQSVLELNDKAVATSGNYRNFYEVNGVKYSHTINPKTGFPERSNLLSVTVITNDCMTADALATTFMVMGIKKGKNFYKKLNNVEVYFIYSDDDGELRVFKLKNE